MRKPKKLPKLVARKPPRYTVLVMYTGGLQPDVDDFICKIAGQKSSAGGLRNTGDRERDLEFDMGEDMVRAKKVRNLLHGKLVGGKYCTASINQS